MRQGHNNNNNNNNNKQRMRGRNRKGPNPLQRSFESNGPDVKIRGTALHIAEKYIMLARDAASSGDRVGEQNYLQHAEHYYRIVAAAQAQMPQQQPFQRPEEFEDEDDLDERGGPYDRPAMQGGENRQQGYGGSDQPFTNGNQFNGNRETSSQGDDGDGGEFDDRGGQGGGAEQQQPPRRQNEYRQPQQGGGDYRPNQGGEYRQNRNEYRQPQPQPIVQQGGPDYRPPVVQGEQPVQAEQPRVPNADGSFPPAGEQPHFRSRGRRSGRGRPRRAEGDFAPAGEVAVPGAPQPVVQVASPVAVPVRESVTEE